MLKTKENKTMNKGISLIVLVITIIVIIILAAAVILTLTGNNPIENAKQATYINDIVSFQDELDMYKANEYAKNLGNFDAATLNASSENTALLFTYIPSLESKTKYIAELSVVAGGLIYTGPTDSVHKDWAAMANISYGAAPVIPEEPVVTAPKVPVLAAGMTPIKWSGTALTDTTSSDSSWYNYESKQWANARTADGSMWVWIPRYEYKIPITHSSTAQTIDVNFIQTTQTTPTSGYIIHPAFDFGGTQLAGIWVAKFEASGTISDLNILPDVSSLRNISIDSMFTSCRDIENNTLKYGWLAINLDTHLMKNIEWGACAYLSQSIYGKNSEIAINGNVNYYTGGAAYKTNINQSTTGNIYGIYDMSGCSYEHVAAYINNGSSNLTTYGTSLINADVKYKDVYVMGSSDTGILNYNANLGKVGDAIYETSKAELGDVNSWYSDYSYKPYESVPFFVRGYYYANNSGAGIFAFSYKNGAADNTFGFRPVLALGIGL